MTSDVEFFLGWRLRVIRFFFFGDFVHLVRGCHSVPYAVSQKCRRQPQQ